MVGLGLRSHVELGPAAFIGGVEQALPNFASHDGVCRLVADVVGEGQGHIEVGRRWEPLLQSGCRTGIEFSQAWTTLQLEATQCANYLGQELVGALAVAVEGAGDESVDGSTRKKIVQQREELRGSVLKEALARLADNPCLSLD